MLRSAVKAFAFAMAVMFSLYSFPLFCLDAVAVAQQTNPYNGKWLAKYISTMGNQFGANVVVKDSGGTWTTTFRSPNNPCLRLTVPIEVARPATDTLEISVWGKKH